MAGMYCWAITVAIAGRAFQRGFRTDGVFAFGADPHSVLCR